MKKELNVLDLFCGAGGLSCGFEKQGFNNLTGVDISKTLISYAIKNANGKINYIQDDVRTAKLLSESFDFVSILGTSLGFHLNEKLCVLFLRRLVFLVSV